jgi:hypothetical protein
MREGGANVDFLKGAGIYFFTVNIFFIEISSIRLHPH